MSLKQNIIDLKLFLQDYWSLEIKNKLAVPSENEKKLIDEFRTKIKSLETTGAGNSWNNFSKKLKRYVLYFDPRNFLHWEVIRLTMTVGSAPPKSLDEMTKSNQWKNKWEKAVVENSFGCPVPNAIIKNSSNTLLHHAWHLFSLQRATNINFQELDLIVEFGGGYGDTLKILRKLGFKGNYIIYDLPEFCLLQNFYLQNITLKTTYNKYNANADEQNILIDNIADFKNILSNIDANKNLFIATWSISETPLKSREEFLNLVNNFDYYLFAYQNKFDNIDNKKYFAGYTKHHHTLKWYKDYTCGQDYYLFGKKIL